MADQETRMKARKPSRRLLQPSRTGPQDWATAETTRGQKHPILNVSEGGDKRTSEVTSGPSPDPGRGRKGAGPGPEWTLVSMDTAPSGCWVPSQSRGRKQWCCKVPCHASAESM